MVLPNQIVGSVQDYRIGRDFFSQGWKRSAANGTLHALLSCFSMDSSNSLIVYNLCITKGLNEANATGRVAAIAATIQQE